MNGCAPRLALRKRLKVIRKWPIPFVVTIRLGARDFYEVIVDEAEGRINYHLIEIESE